MRNIPLSIKKRPALKLAALAVVGLLIGYFFDVSPVVLLFSLITLSIAATILLCVNNSLTNCFLIVTFIVASFLSYEFSTRVFSSRHITNFVDLNEKVIVVGTVKGLPDQKRDRVEIELETDQILHGKVRQAVQGKILVRIWQQKFFPGHGEKLQIHGKLYGPRGERNPGEFNYKKFLAADGIYGMMNIYNPMDVIAVDSSPRKSIPYFISRLKRRFYFSLDELYHDKVGAILKALLLGERGEISPELKNAFINCGVIHALAISGLHVGYIIFIFFTLFSLIRFSYEARIIAVLISLLVYNMIVGFQPPVVRASLMAGIFLVGRLLQRQTDILNIISAAALIILLINPQQLFLASFQLSFAAVISIVFLYQRLKIFFDKSSLFTKLSSHKVGDFFGKLFLVTLAAQLGTLPLVAYYFHRISIISLLMNLAVIPLLGIIIALGLLSLMTSLVSIPIAQFYANTNTVLLESMIRVLEKFGQYEFSAIEIGKIGLIEISSYYILLWIIIHLDKKFYRKVLVFSILIITLVSAWKPIFHSEKWMTVIFFDVGQGDAALVTFPDGKNLLIDSGPCFDDFDAGAAFILPYLKRERIKKVDATILTHADLDHIGGMASVFRNIPVAKVYDSGVFQMMPICTTYNHIIDSLNIPHQLIFAGQSLNESEQVGLFILHPTRSFSASHPMQLNECSVVLKIVYGQVSFLFTGDIENESEQLLLQYGSLLRSDVIKIPHHGSNTSSSFELLKCVQPEYAVISVGKNNRFNLPDWEVLRRLDNLEIATIRTDLNGAVIFKTNGIRLKRIR